MPKYTKCLKKKIRLNKTKKGGNPFSNLWPFKKKDETTDDKNETTDNKNETTDNKNETTDDKNETTDNNTTPAQNDENVVNIYTSDKISIQSIPTNYKSIGILHITESGAINAIRDIGTGFFNAFGNKGFDNVIYDDLRKNTFDKVINNLKNEQKVFNLRLDFETNTQGTTIFLHIYGDLCEPINGSEPEKEPEKESETEPEPEQENNSLG
jgi:hypothetical protein